LRYETVLSLTVDADSREEAVETMVTLLHDYGHQVNPDDFGKAGGEDDALLEVSDVDAVLDDAKGALSIWYGSMGERAPLQGIFHVVAEVDAEPEA
jgi:hypothetical protein